MTAAPDATSPASQVGDDHGSFSQAKIPTAQADWPVLDPEAPELAQVAQCLAMCIREVPGWADSASLITAHCHATVLAQDLAATPDASQPGMSEANAPIPAVQSGAVAWTGDAIPYECPLPSLGRKGAPYAYNIDPGAGSAMDRLQRDWPGMGQVSDLRLRGGTITPLYAAPQSEPLPGGAGEGHPLSDRLRTAEVYELGDCRHEIGILLTDAANELDRLAALSGKEQG